MNFRRFLYLVANDGFDRSYSLRRIDMSRFFFRTPTEGVPTPLDSSGAAGAADPSAVEDGGRLPDPVINVCPPHLEHRAGMTGFVLFENKGNGGHNKVVAMDNMGRSFICNPDLPPTVRALPNLASSKLAPISLTVGDSLYVLDAIPVPPNGRNRHSFEVLLNDDNRSFKRKDWYWNPLDPPPHVYATTSSTHIESYTVVAGSNILVSNKASAKTYCFDTVNKTWSKAGDWVLPFTHLAEYLPMQKLWFGISSIKEGHRFCAANLVASTDSKMRAMPLVHRFWKEYAEPPREWSLSESYAVHLGSSKFCIVRLFTISKLHVCPERHDSDKIEEELQAVLTGVEVQSCGEDVCVVKHKSERYKLDLDGGYWVL